MTRSERLWKERQVCDTSLGYCNILEWSQMQCMPVSYVGSEICTVNGLEVEVDIYESDLVDCFYGCIGNGFEWESVKAHKVV